MPIKCIFFDWNGTLAQPGTRRTFMYSKDLRTRLGTLKYFALGLLAFLKFEGYHIGLITNTKFSHIDFIRALQETGLTLFINEKLVFVSSDPNYCNKPCPEIFLAALNKAGCTPEETLFVGDNCSADILGARKVGIVPVYISTINNCDYTPYHIQSLSQLLEIKPLRK